MSNHTNVPIHHLYTKSICGYKIFRRKGDYRRMTNALQFYQYIKRPMPFADFQRLVFVKRQGFTSVVKKLSAEQNWGKQVDVLAYCLMPTHVHFLVAELYPGVISLFMKNLLISYSRYYNESYDRSGPLWQGRFGRSRVGDHEGLINAATYVHLNPTSAYLVDMPENWAYSSIHELRKFGTGEGFCRLFHYLRMSEAQYYQYVLSQLEKQRQDKRNERKDG